MGFPKTQIHIDGKPILAHLMRQLAWQGPSLLVTAPGRTCPDGAEIFEREVVDPVAGEGPLRGLLTALDHARTERVIVVTVDMPAINSEQLDLLVAYAESQDGRDAVMIRREDRIEPFPSIFRRTMRESIRDMLRSGIRAMRELAQLDSVSVISAPNHWPQSVWTNLNSPADLIKSGIST